MNLDKTSFDRVGYRAGLGMQYDFNDNFSARVVDDAITAFIEAGGSYPFYRNG